MLFSALLNSSVFLVIFFLHINHWIGRGYGIGRRSGRYSAIALLLTVISGNFLTGFASNTQSLLQQHILSGLFVLQHTIMKRSF